MGIHNSHTHRGSFIFKGLTGGWGLAAKLCDSCKSTSAAVFCRADSAFLCITCDTEIHSTNKLTSRHQRVWMCEVCEQAPASVTCRADAAALCVTCDSDIHSANPLARRHERIPIEPFFDSAAESVIKSSPATNFLVPNVMATDVSVHQHESENGLWVIPNSNFGSKCMDSPDMMSSAEGLLFSEVDDPFLDFEYQNSIETKSQQTPFGAAANDSVVPIQTKTSTAPMLKRSCEPCFNTDFRISKLSSFSYPTQSISQSVSSSEFGVVPDGNSLSEISFELGGNLSNGADPKGTASTMTKTNQATQLCGLDREAMVLRYREKRKNRKFEKIVRYASRKAYAEARPGSERGLQIASWEGMGLFQFGKGNDFCGKPWHVAMAWKNPSSHLMAQIEQIECGMRLMVQSLVIRMRQAQAKFVQSVAKDWLGCRGSKEAAREKVSEAMDAQMDELVSIFLDANRLKRSILTEIVNAISVYQAALFLAV